MVGNINFNNEFADVIDINGPVQKDLSQVMSECSRFPYGYLLTRKEILSLGRQVLHDSTHEDAVIAFLKALDGTENWSNQLIIMLYISLMLVRKKRVMDEVFPKVNKNYKKLVSEFYKMKAERDGLFNVA